MTDQTADKHRSTALRALEYQRLVELSCTSGVPPLHLGAKGCDGAKLLSINLSIYLCMGTPEVPYRYTMGTLPQTFRDLVGDPDSSARYILECGPDRITYLEYGAVVDSLAFDLHARLGERPTLAIVAANCPYTLAIILATWSIGGVVAPLDHHTPRGLLIAMLHKVQPDEVVVSTVDEHTCAWVTASGYSLHSFTPEAATLPTLLSRCVRRGLSSTIAEAARDPEDVALYLYTSSASSHETLKCVPLSHKAIYYNCVAQLDWLRSAFPERSYNRLRVLTWAPWSHIMGISHDIGAHLLLTGGSLVFAIVPPSYEAPADARLSGKNVSCRIMEALLTKDVDTFAGVPWVLEGLMDVWASELDPSTKANMTTALRNIKIIIVGGAPSNEATVLWATNLNLALVHGIGMTELAGPLFHARVTKDWKGWSRYPLVADAQLYLVNGDGKTDSVDGELYVRSRLISTGYIQYPNSAFSVDDHGFTTFRTGDLWSCVDGHFIWRGRVEEYIYMTSGEILDPRLVERSLEAHAAIKKACVIGNNFLDGPSEHVCAVVELKPASLDAIADVLQAIAAANSNLPPPLRIAWTRVVILPGGRSIPLTRKKMVFRKKIRELFAPLLAQQEVASSGELATASTADNASLTLEQIRVNVRNVLCMSGISKNALALHPGATFSDLGMTSVMAVAIVNHLNRLFHLDLPLESCHIFVDWAQLTAKVAACLGISAAPPLSTLPTESHTTTLNIPDETVVIVGMACRLPGAIDTPEAFWTALLEQRDDLMTPVPANRWDHSSFYKPKFERPGDITHQKAGFVRAEAFDHAYFGISPSEALVTSPFARLVLETVFDALENATIPASSLKGSDTGVFVAAGVEDGYSHLLVLSQGYEAANRFSGQGMANSAASGRISYLLDVHGPSITVDTACSGGQVAFDLAVKHLRSGKGETALVCAANTHAWPGSFAFTSAQQMTSPDSRCATFSIDANGYVPSEGAVALVLKTRSAALRDGDPILATVVTSLVKHDGRSQGLIAPNGVAQAALQRELLIDAQLQPSDIDFIEAHGTGTALGDQIEAQAINDVFRSSHDMRRPLLVGAAKSCVGHTEGAAGLVGVLKTVLSLRNHAVPGIVHLNDNNVNPSIDLCSVPLCLPRETVLLQRRLNKTATTPYRAMALAYGFAGTIAGAILESSPMDTGPETSSETFPPQAGPMLFVLSAKSNAALHEHLRRYFEFCARADGRDFHNICYSTCISRDHHRFRFACVAWDLGDLVDQLERAMSRTTSASIIHNPALLFAFPGQGTQYAGMAVDLASRYPDFKGILMDAAKEASALTATNISDLLLSPTAQNIQIIAQSQTAQVCIFVYQYAICQWLQMLGITPDAVMGHSLGEIAASVACGSSTFKSALHMVVLRGQLMRADPLHPGAMAAISATEDAIEAPLHAASQIGTISIAVSNSPTSHVVSGDRLAVEHFVTIAKDAGHRTVCLNVDQAFHSKLVAMAAEPLRLWLLERVDSARKITKPFMSSAVGAVLNVGETLDADYWAAQLRNPVKFASLLTLLSRSDQRYVTLDIGPQPVLATIIRNENVFTEDAVASVTAKSGSDQVSAFLSGLAALFEAGFTPEFGRLYAGQERQYSKTPLPTYPWQRQQFWPTFIPSRTATIALPVLDHPSLRTSPVYDRTNWTVSSILLDTLKEHTIDGEAVMPGAALAAFVTGFSSAHVHSDIISLRFHMPLTLRQAALGSSVSLQYSDNGAFVVMHDGQRISSGRIQPVSAAQPATEMLWQNSITLPLRVMQGADIYAQLTSVYFGTAFRNVEEVRFYDSYAEALIIVKPAINPSQDFIRQLDPCLHMMASLFPTGVQGGPDLKTGAFLPSSLEGFAIHTIELPMKFRCRYQLPLQSSRDNHVMSSSFQVVSLSGAVLATCDKYSVAWVPTGLSKIGKPIPPQNVPEPSLLHYQWTPQSLKDDAGEPTSTTSRLDAVVIFTLCHCSMNGAVNLVEPTVGRGMEAAYKLSLSPSGHLLLEKVTHDSDNLPIPGGYPIWETVDTATELSGKRLLIIVDGSCLTCAHNPHTLDTITLSTLKLLQLIVLLKLDVSSLVALTSGSKLFDGELASLPLSLVSSAVYGLLKVFRREMDLTNNIVWSLEVPPEISPQSMHTLLFEEIAARQGTTVHGAIVRYRTSHMAGDERQILALELSPPTSVDFAKTRHVVICTGLGSIGQALAKHWLASGSSVFVFLGRRPENDETVIASLATLRAGLEHGVVSYMQADVADLTATMNALFRCQKQYGNVDAIIHTAAVIEDNLIPRITDRKLSSVLRPKVNGAWNLHVASQKLRLRLSMFAMLSSISVPFGNPGQAAYVAGNTFMDTLAVHRHRVGLPAHALQLGPWESNLIANMHFTDAAVLPLHHREGMTLIEKALSSDKPVQIIARVDWKVLSVEPWAAQDPLFNKLLSGPMLASPVPGLPEMDATAIPTPVSELNVENLVRSCVSELAGVPEHDLDLREPLSHYGLDSIAFSQLRGRVAKEAQVNLPISFLSDAYSLRDIVDHIVRKASVAVV